MKQSIKRILFNKEDLLSLLHDVKKLLLQFKSEEQISMIYACRGKRKFRAVDILSAYVSSDKATIKKICEYEKEIKTTLVYKEFLERHKKYLTYKK